MHSIRINKEQDVAPWLSVCTWCDGLWERFLLVDLLTYFSLIGKSSLCSDSWFPSEWSFTIYLTPYNSKNNYYDYDDYYYDDDDDYYNYYYYYYY